MGGVGERLKEGMYVCIWLILFVVQLPLTQQCQVIVILIKKETDKPLARLKKKNRKDSLKMNVSPFTYYVSVHD